VQERFAFNTAVTGNATTGARLRRLVFPLMIATALSACDKPQAATADHKAAATPTPTASIRSRSATTIRSILAVS
jgi:hypothetical protein